MQQMWVIALGVFIARKLSAQPIVYCNKTGNYGTACTRPYPLYTQLGIAKREADMFAGVLDKRYKGV